ncbi:Thiol:disulfide interchange protein DsbD [bioreactor metagenome]|jgi:thiol:disulfide interchange protein|uniref:Thiol:disulfide interchange protein DsbD n=1 Tax=bioreactor metagenome TaxID=1076179 RepID=A0A644WNX0_9ZZZZ|nr:cytochrome c biogenesis protein CcdA [Paludibacter sp.]
MIKKIHLLILFTLVTHVVFGQIFEPVTWSHELKITGKTTGEIIHKATIEDKWHLYGMNIPKNGPRPTRIVYENLTNAEKDGDIIAKSKLLEVFDKSFDMNLSWYANEAIFVQKIKFKDAAQVKIEGYVEFMACDDERCLPPVQDEFSLGNAKVTQVASATKETIATKPVELKSTIEEKEISENNATIAPVNIPGKELNSTITDYWKPVIDELRAFGNQLGSSGDISLWLIFLAGLAGGFLALFTPCVWPIIPMTVSFFLKRSEKKAKGRRDAILYGLSIILIYVTLGVLITVIFGASALNSMSTNAVFNLLFFALLVVFAISFFGAFEITLPASWSTKLDAKADSTAGILSILFMAFTLVLVSFSCTGPIIGTLLVEVASSGTILAPAIGMLGFAVALAIPFTFFAFFPSLLKSMPKSGGWLNKVKVVLAFLELALALKFLSVADLAYGWRILDREVFISLWIIIFALLGFYLLGKIRFPHDSESKHTSVLGTFLAIISLSFALYMVPGLWGAPLKAISAFAPPLTTQDFNLYDYEVHAEFSDYEAGMKYAAEKGKPVVVDFSGYGCVNCRKMEASVWTHPRVKELLENDYVLITLFVDDKTPLNNPYTIEENGKTRTIRTVGDKWSYLQRVKFGANAQPYYVMLDNNGLPLNSPFTFDENPDNFISWLERE